MERTGRRLARFVIQVRPESEKMVAAALMNKGHATFLLLRRGSRRPSSGWESPPLSPNCLLRGIEARKRRRAMISVTLRSAPSPLRPTRTG